MRDDGMPGSAELLPYVVLRHAACFPSAIEMFEVLADEPGLGLVAENEFGIGHRAVSAKVPRLTDLEVAAQLHRRVGRQRNGHHGIEQFFGLFEVGIESRQKEEMELGKLSKQRQVRFEMVHKFRETCLGPLQVGEHHHRRGRSMIGEEHREFIHEVPKRGLRGLLAVVNLGGKEVSRDLQLIAEMAEFFWFGFEIPVLWMRQDKVEDSNAPLNVFEFMLPPVAKVLSADLAVYFARENVIDLPAHWEVLGARVLLRVQLAPESGRALALMARGESEELTGHKVTRMGGHNV